MPSKNRKRKKSKFSLRKLIYIVDSLRNYDYSYNHKLNNFKLRRKTERRDSQCKFLSKHPK